MPKMMPRHAEPLDKDALRNDVASPRLNIVHTELNRRHASLCHAPNFTPRVEEAIDKVMAMSPEDFAAHCRDNGSVVVIEHDAEEAIKEAIANVRRERELLRNVHIAPIGFDDIPDEEEEEEDPFPGLGNEEDDEEDDADIDAELAALAKFR